MRVLPGDPLAAISGEGGGMYVLNQEQLRAARATLGLDRPYVVQYFDWLKDVLRGDLGKSFWRGEPIRELIVRRAPITGQIALMAVILSWMIGVPVGVLGAVWRNSRTDYAVRLVVTLFMAIPSFWVALVNAMLPIMTVTGTALGALLGGSVAVERAFGVPGLGLALVFAVAERDWMLIQNLVLLYGVIFVLINLVVDVSYGWFDPRIRYQ